MERNPFYGDTDSTLIETKAENEDEYRRVRQEIIDRIKLRCKGTVFERGDR